MSFFKPEDFRGTELSRLDAAENANKKLKESGYLDYILQVELSKKRQAEAPIEEMLEPEYVGVNHFFKHPDVEGEVVGLHFTYFAPLLPNEDHLEAVANVYSEDGTWRFSSYRINNREEDEVKSYIDDGFEILTDFQPKYSGDK